MGSSEHFLGQNPQTIGIQSYCTIEHEQKRFLLVSSRSQIQTLICSKCIYISGTISTSICKISSKESLRTSDKKICLTLRCKGHSNSAGLQGFYLTRKAANARVPKSALRHCKVCAIPVIFQCKTEIWSSDLQPTLQTHITPGR